MRPGGTFRSMIHMDGVTREYGGWASRARGRRVRALDGVSLTVPPGTALGIVGPNGAGKSTLIRVLLGYLRPTSGNVTLGGLPPRRYVERFGVGYIPEEVAIPPRWTVRGALEAYAALGDLPNAHMRIDAVLGEMGIEGLAQRRVGALSKGNRQRLAIAQALLGDRKLLIADEPLDGLDPHWVARFRTLVAEWRAADPERILVMVSHNLHEIERVTDRVAFLIDGVVRETVDPRAPTDCSHVSLTLHDPSDAVLAAVGAAFPGMERGPRPGAVRVQVRDAGELNRGLAAAISAGAVIVRMEPEHTSLEERLQHLLGDTPEGSS